MTDRRKTRKKRASRKNSVTEVPAIGDSIQPSTSINVHCAKISETSNEELPSDPATNGNAPNAVSTLSSVTAISSQCSPSTGAKVPRTLVNGTYREHDPDSLPEPLRQGFIDWANSQRRKPGDEERPHDEAEVMYNNRTLRYWRLSTDYSRFQPDNFELTPSKEHVQPKQEELGVEEDQVYEIVNGVTVEVSATSLPAALTYLLSSPQRPYTAPPHQLPIRRT